MDEAEIIDPGCCLMVDVYQLRQRGWTEGLIRRFLGEPDDWEPVNHYANFTGKRVYSLQRVEATEADESFDCAFRASVKRRKIKNKAAFIKERNKTTGLVNDWLQSQTPEQIETARTLEKVASLIEEARKRGYRTPHKC